MITGYELVEKMYSENYDEYEDTRLYSTGDSELDDLLERAFCEGYEYAQREFSNKENKIAKRDYENKLGRLWGSFGGLTEDNIPTTKEGNDHSKRLARIIQKDQTENIIAGIKNGIKQNLTPDEKVNVRNILNKNKKNWKMAHKIIKQNK